LGQLASVQTVWSANLCKTLSTWIFSLLAWIFNFNQSGFLAGVRSFCGDLSEFTFLILVFFPFLIV